MTRRTIWTWVAAAAALGLSACGSDSNGSAAPPPAPPTAGQCTPPATPTATFAAQVQPILTAKCGTCHGTAWGSPDRATAYAAAKAQVNTASPDTSALVQKGDAKVAHAGGDRLDPAEVTSITAWIRECAQNN